MIIVLHDETHNMNVFLKGHHPHFPDMLADRRFLGEARHAFLIRRPEEIAASTYALWPGMNLNSIGLEKLCELQAASRDAGGVGYLLKDRVFTDEQFTDALYTVARGGTVMDPRGPRADGRGQVEQRHRPALVHHRQSRQQTLHVHLRQAEPATR